MHPELQRCLTLIDEATAGLDEASAGTRVDGRWSVAEIVEHLDRTYTGTTKGFERCLNAGVSRASAPTLKSRLRIFAVVTLGYFPSGIEAPAHVVPTGRVSLNDVLEKVRAHLQALDGAAAATEARLGRGRVMDHPILGPFTVAQWMRFHRVHTRHHQKQIVERRRRLGSLA
jgi:hypothetical protein